MPILCEMCRRNVEPIETFERDPKTRKGWILTRCPYERCQHTFDLKLDDGKYKQKNKNGGRYFWNGSDWE